MTLDSPVFPACRAAVYPGNQFPDGSRNSHCFSICSALLFLLLLLGGRNTLQALHMSELRLWFGSYPRMIFPFWFIFFLTDHKDRLRRREPTHSMPQQNICSSVVGVPFISLVMTILFQRNRHANLQWRT